MHYEEIFAAISAIGFGFTMNINAQEPFDYVIVQDNWTFYSRKTFMPLTTIEGSTHYRWAAKYGVSFSNITPSTATPHNPKS